MFSKCIFLISESFRGLYRTKTHALISSVTISISLIILSISIFTYYNFISLSKNIKSEFAIQTFFENDVSTNEEAQDLYNKILFINGIQEGEFIDKQKAAEIFRKYFDEDVEEVVGENPLPMSANYTILENFRNLEDIKLIESKIREVNGVEDVLFERTAVKKINSVIEIILSILFLIGIFILFISVVLISNTITLIIYSKQRTIEILQLLGASNRFIKFPFVLEGILQGFLGSMLSIIILFFLNSLQVYFIESMAISHLVIPPIIVPCNIVLGIALGIIGSYRGLSNRF